MAYYKVVIEVSGGVVEVTECPEEVEVFIIDHDNDAPTGQGGIIMKPIDYITQAEAFCDKYQVTINIKWVACGKYFADDKEARDIYEIVIVRTNFKPYKFRFGQSIAKTFKCSDSDYPIRPRKRVAPTAYDVLACLTKYDPGTFENFCGDYGHDTDSQRGLKTYLDVQNEWTEVRRLFGDALEDLANIQ